MIDEGSAALERLGGVIYVQPTGPSTFRVLFGAETVNKTDLDEAASLTEGIKGVVANATPSVCPDGFCVEGELRSGELGDSDNLRVVNFFEPECDYIGWAQVHICRRQGMYAGTRVTISLPDNGPKLPNRALPDACEVGGALNPGSVDPYTLTFSVVDPDRNNVTAVLTAVAERLRIYISSITTKDDDPNLAGFPEFNQMPGSENAAEPAVEAASGPAPDSPRAGLGDGDAEAASGGVKDRPRHPDGLPVDEAD